MKKFSFYLLMSCMLLCSCNSEDNTDENSSFYSGEEATLAISLSASDYTDDHLPGESTIRSITLHIFNADSTRDEKTPYYHIKEEKNVVLVPVTPGIKSVVVVVNNSTSTVQESSFSDLMRTIFVRVINNPTGSANISGDIFSSWEGIPMNGMESGIVVKPGEIKKVPVKVKRLLSRINPPTTNGCEVSLSEGEKKRLEEETGKHFTDQLTFTLDAHIVINGGRSFMLFPDYGVTYEFERWTKWIRLPSYVKSEYNEAGQLVSAYSSNHFLENSEPVYVYENSPRYESELYPESTRKLFPASMVYAFIVRGILKDDSGTSAVRYWRINIAKESYLENQKVATYQILRNSIYKVNIIKVLTAGYETPEEAEKELPYIPTDDDAAILTQIEVNNWKVFSWETDI